MSYPNQISNPPSTNWAVQVNENLDALAHQGVYGYDVQTSDPLVWGYFGGRWGGFAVAAGTLALTDAATNYIVVLKSTGAISVSASGTNWASSLYARVYLVTTAGGVVTATEDHRSGPSGVHGGGAVSGGGDALVANPLSQFAATTSAQLAGVISDETGTGALVFSDSPALTGNPTAPTQSAGNNSTRLATTAYTDAAVAALINSAPGALDTLDELAAALGDDANFAATVTTALTLKAPLASPALTGTPTVPTAAPGTNTTQAASTAYVEAAVAAAGGGDALTANPLSQFAATTSAQLRGVLSDETGTGAAVFADSPALTGNPTAPTASPGDNDTTIATTAFVTAAVAAGGSSSGYTKGASWSGGGSALTTSADEVVVYMPASGTISRVTVLGLGGPGSCVIDIWKDVFANYPPTVADTITASAKPTISAANAVTSTTLTGWTTTVTAGDCLLFHIDSVSGFTGLSIFLEITP